jgi:hypothetical protein
MSNHRFLASVADGTARAFIGRNNDVGGWWALGLLLDALPTDSDFTVDLITGTAAPALANPDLAHVGPAWATYFRWSLGRHGVPEATVRAAVLTVRFDRSRSVPSWLPDRSDCPFLCAVRIEDVAGREFERLASGHCSPQSDFRWALPPRRPMRSGLAHDDPGRMGYRMRPRSRSG